MNSDESINKLNNRSDLTVKITNLSNELIEELELTESCTSCKDKIRGYYFNGIYQSINIIENHLVRLEKKEKEEQEKEDIIHKLSDELIKMNDQLNRDVLCGNCR